jgi:hypothetical protein
MGRSSMQQFNARKRRQTRNEYSVVVNDGTVLRRRPLTGADVLDAIDSGAELAADATSKDKASKFIVDVFEDLAIQLEHTGQTESESGDHVDGGGHDNGDDVDAEWLRGELDMTDAQALQKQFSDETWGSEGN